MRLVAVLVFALVVLAVILAIIAGVMVYVLLQTLWSKDASARQQRFELYPERSEGQTRAFDLL